MKQYRYIGESNSFLTKNKIYEIKKDNNFIDDIGCVNYLGSLLNENFKEIKHCPFVLVWRVPTNLINLNHLYLT